MALKIEGSNPSVHPIIVVMMVLLCWLLVIFIVAPVAQGTEHLASNQRVGGSNPSGRAILVSRLSSYPYNAAYERVVGLGMGGCSGYSQSHGWAC